MQCPACGKQNLDVARFCGGCGRPLPALATEPGAVPGTGAGMAMPAPGPMSAPSPVPAPSLEPGPRTRGEILAYADGSGMGMKWYKFLIYFALFASCVANLVSGVLQLTGLEYSIIATIQGHSGVTSETVYGIYPGLQVLDIVCGSVLVAVGILSIVARMLLAKFKASGITMLLVLYAVEIIESIAYFVLSIVMLGKPASFVPSFVGSLVGTMIMVVVNMVYFNKRKHLFVN